MKVLGEIPDTVKTNLNVQDTAELFADRHLLERVFINLFSNASDAMEGGGLLEVTVSPSPESLVVRVSDTGKGIPPKEMQRIFDPFFSTKEKGTGLGLAIVYNIIERHKGKISVESEVGKGTVFTVVLPRGLS
jgi:signal transduction histidine kinase